MHKSLLINFITSNRRFDDYSLYRRTILINALLLITVFVFSAFSYVNFFNLNNYFISFLDAIFAITSILTIIYLRIAKDIANSALIATLNLSLFFLIFIYINQNDHLGIIWTLLVPIFSIFVNGRKRGLLISLLFSFALLLLAYDGIGKWEGGYWNETDFLRLFSALVILIFIIYINEFALEKSDSALANIRILEHEHIEELKKISITDPLTGLYNRRYFSAISPRLLAHARENDEYIAFFMIDVDHFKEYNDYYGHKMGDDVLQKIAFFIKKHIKRYNDYAFRIGGEEFAGIVYSRSNEDTKLWLGELCGIIESLRIEHKQSSVSKYVTVSMGVKISKVKKDENIEYFYKESDKALYSAKKDGRNRVVFI